MEERKKRKRAEPPKPTKKKGEVFNAPITPDTKKNYLKERRKVLAKKLRGRK
jgi:hypothetical protein